MVASDVNRNRSHASGQYLGYSLQSTRFLVRLLNSEPGWSVSLEVFEDVGVETPKGNKIAEQDKSSSDGNPVSNHAIDLWKTFSNWVDSVKSGELNSETTQFIIYVSHPHKGEIVERFSKAKTNKEAQEAFLYARAMIWGSAPTFSLKPNLPKALNCYVDNVFSVDKSLIYNIIQNFQYEFGSGSPQEDLKILFTKKVQFIGLEIVEEALVYALGWVKEHTDRLLEQKRPACISVDLFNKDLSSFIRKYDRRNILLTYAGMPSSKEIDDDLKVKNYVRQLDIIEIDDDIKIRAVIDYLKASVDRTEWGKRGLVHRSSFNEFSDTLVRTWNSHKLKSDLLVGYSDLHKGRHLYAECSCQQVKLENLQVPDHFTPGSFHALSDIGMIGWHPNYKEKLKINLIGVNT